MAPVSSAPTGVTLGAGSLRSGGFADLAADDAALCQVNSTTRNTRTTSWYGRFSGVPSTLQNLRITYKGANSLTCTQAIAIYDWSTRAWQTLDSRSVGSTEVLIADLAPAGTLSNLRSSTGELRVRVECRRSSSNFFASANLLRIAYDQP